MIAGLPMYERPELFQAHDNLWQLIHKQIDGSPQKLSRNVALWDLWTSPELLLAQTCSSPYRESLFKNTIYVGTPDYKLPNCPPGYYNSIIIGQSDLSFSQLKTGIFGYNDKFSHSGWTAPINHFKKQYLATPLKKQVDVKEICNAVDFFIKNSSITGQILAIDSGQSLNWQTPDILKGKE